MTDSSHIKLANNGAIGCSKSSSIGQVGVIEFTGHGKVIRNCPLSLANLAVKGTVDVGPSTKIINTLKMMGEAALIINAPLYQIHSNLVYCSGNTIDRGMEWSAMQ